MLRPEDLQVFSTLTGEAQVQAFLDVSVAVVAARCAGQLFGTLALQPSIYCIYQ